MDVVNTLRLMLVVPGAIAALYIGWLAFVPVTADNVETRLTHTCYIGQAFASISGTADRHHSCECALSTLKSRAGLSVMAKGAEYARTVISEQIVAVISGQENPQVPDTPADPELSFAMAATEEAKRVCTVQTAAR